MSIIFHGKHVANGKRANLSKINRISKFFMLLITDRVLECDLCMNFVYKDCVMISTNQKAYFKRSAVFWKMTKVVLPNFSRMEVAIYWSI